MFMGDLAETLASRADSKVAIVTRHSAVDFCWKTMSLILIQDVSQKRVLYLETVSKRVWKISISVLCLLKQPVTVLYVFWRVWIMAFQKKVRSQWRLFLTVGLQVGLLVCNAAIIHVCSSRPCFWSKGLDPEWKRFKCLTFGLGSRNAHEVAKLQLKWSRERSQPGFHKSKDLRKLCVEELLLHFFRRSFFFLLWVLWFGRFFNTIKTPPKVQTRFTTRWRRLCCHSRLHGRTNSLVCWNFDSSKNLVSGAFFIHSNILYLIEHLVDSLSLIVWVLLAGFYQSLLNGGDLAAAQSCGCGRPFWPKVPDLKMN